MEASGRLGVARFHLSILSGKTPKGHLTMNNPDVRVFARFILLGLILIGLGYDIAALTVPAFAPPPTPTLIRR